MTRTFYHSLLWLHPRRFRGAMQEMTWIFDETASRQGKGISLLRWAHLAGETVGDAHWMWEDSPRSFWQR